MQEMGSTLYFLILYLFFMVLLPAKVLRLPMGRKQIADSTVKALLVSYTVCISLVYALGLLHIYNRYTLILGIILTLLVYGAVRKVKYRKIFMDATHVLALLSGGQYRAEIFVKKWLKKTGKDIKEEVKGFIKELTVLKVVCFLVCLAAFVILMEHRMTAFFGTYAYRTSDMYVHNEWINYMEAGDIFYDGIYPFGMHNMISALHLLSGLHMSQIFRYYGALNCFLTVAAAVYFLRRVAQTKAAVVIYLILYGVTSFCGNAFVYRMGFTLPQECAMPFMLVSVLLLGKFFESKKKEDGIYFALASSLVLSTHFFTVIFAVALCGSLFLVYLPRIWKEKLILPLCRLLLLILCISMLPFLIGKLEGKYWQGSMTWALGVINSQKDEEEEKAEEAEEIELEAVTDQAQEPDSTEDPKSRENVFSLFFNMMIEKMYDFWGYVFWAGMIFGAVYFLLVRKAWKDWRCKQFFAVWMTLAFCVLLIGYWIIGIPQLMKEERVRMFVGYLGPIILGLPFEALAVCFGRWGKRFSEGLGLLAAAMCFYVTYGLGCIPFQTYFYLQTSTAAQACVKLTQDYKKNTWTVVSPVEELSLIRGQGYHYELWEFIEKMERYEEDRYLEIPTKYVFFVLEKIPVAYNTTRIMGQSYDDAPVSLKEAEGAATREMLGISEKGTMKYYNIIENRRMLEAKLSAWLAAYEKLFPDQISIYMESEECVVYRLEQNIFALNNLAIDYGYNVISDEEYENMLAGRTLLEEED